MLVNNGDAGKIAGISAQPACLERHTNRREFLITAAGLALTTVLPACSQTHKNIQTSPPPPPVIASLTNLELKASCGWVAKGEHKTSYALYKKAAEAATDFSWLSRGDRVLIKLSLNSGNRYPATTDPWSVHCMIRLLQEKGAGSIIVADQSSYGTVKWTKSIKQGSSRQLARRAGLLGVIEGSGASPFFFEEAGWDAYRPAWPAGEHHWKNPIMIPAIASKLRLTESSGRTVLTLFGPNDGPKATPFACCWASCC